MSFNDTKLPKGFLREFLNMLNRDRCLEHLSLKRYYKVVELSKRWELTLNQAKLLVSASCLCAMMGIRFIDRDYKFIKYGRLIGIDKNLILLLTWHSGIQDVSELTKFIHRFSRDEIKRLGTKLANGEDIRDSKIWISTDESTNQKESELK